MSTDTSTNAATHVVSERPGTSFSAAINNSCEKIEECVRENPGSTMMVTLGMGLAVGVTAGLILSGSQTARRQSWLGRELGERGRLSARGG